MASERRQTDAIRSTRRDSGIATFFFKFRGTLYHTQARDEPSLYHSLVSVFNRGVFKKAVPGMELNDPCTYIRLTT